MRISDWSSDVCSSDLRAVADAKAVNDAANTILLRAHSRDSVTVFPPEAFDLAELFSIKRRSFFSSASARGVPIPLVRSRKSFNRLAESQHRFLRETAVLTNFRIHMAETKLGRYAHKTTTDITYTDHHKNSF